MFKRFLLGALLAATLPAFANPYETTLGNGLRVIVKEDRRAPTAVHMLCYRAAAVDEVDGRSGSAHMLERMMFKGTPTVGPGEFNRRVTAVGGRDSVFSNRDYTAYFQHVAKDKLEMVMQLEADRMRHLSIDPLEFARELNVFIEERRLRTDNDPQAKLFEQMNAAAWQVHPYRRPVIGWMDDLENMSAADVRAWYEQWYVPNNGYLVVVGDVDHQVVFKLAEQYYGTIAARALPHRRAAIEPEQLGQRRIVVKAPTEVPLLVMAYKAPVLRDATKDREPYALEMLGAILDGYDAARLGRRLVREQRIATQAGAGYDIAARGPGLFYLLGSPSPGKTVAELEAALRGEITRIQQEGVAEAELKRARAQFVAAQTYKLDSMVGQAMEIGATESTGLSYRDHDTMIARAQQVSVADVQAVARKYLTDDTLTVGVLEPQTLDGKGRRFTSAIRH